MRNQLSLYILIILVGTSISCQQESHKQNSNVLADTISPRKVDTVIHSVHPNIDTTSLLKKFEEKIYAYGNAPCTWNIFDKSLGDTLSYYIERISTRKQIMIDSANVIKYFDILLLKNYLNDLSCANQSYDLLQERRTIAAKIVTSYFFSFYRVDITKAREGWSDGNPYMIIKKKPMKTPLILSLIKRIEIEENRIASPKWKYNPNCDSSSSNYSNKK